MDAKLYASFFLISLNEKTSTALKINEAVEKIIWKASKTKFLGFIMFINIQVMKLRSTDWTSSLSNDECPKMDLYFIFEFCSYLELFSTPGGLKSLCNVCDQFQKKI